MKPIKVERSTLQHLASIQPGYPFRGKLPLDDRGDAFVVQYRHMTLGECLNDKSGSALDRVVLPGLKHPEYLRSGDILFMAKGPRNYATLVGEVPSNTVCTPNFYHLRLAPRAHGLTPEFLVWQLNHVNAQRYFARCSQGTSAPSITKAQLGGLPIVIPPIEKQEQMVRLANAATQEQRLLHRLIENRQRMIDVVGHELLNSNSTTGK
ncbi:restriction endonuclease subunit S [Larsenimonas suaedae]|uniref:Restriction endonuclease subunit S n=1 Tax=Larsenimonas suaedae TaxID=1851019 RepID=A0ABU1GTK0_9GAMM|nr:restriction endonuclease subunit S [Larsenimonas suaedae]MCM2971803.1 restriction endonuclease subunit S [Larsenimonas suaedae]MDR5895355.1 restriction endonuclease subunit S [Larsenimonas suaedae]